MKGSLLFILSRYFWAVRSPPQDAEDRWGITAGMRPIGSTNHQWGMKKLPLMEVSLYLKRNGQYVKGVL
ncbi:hypothetical protein BACCIP111899_00809 [Bacillus rhizoplanae]|uniref:Uncharacterized protein n=1 Tax=Bacillus rhizoplanae TaxID=2880966 RepID=A0ABM8Y7E1_9BACI|nr:hypothetical protein BACCIP111899_00809 [Bacillus rhizoplanae]